MRYLQIALLSLAAGLSLSCILAYQAVPLPRVHIPDGIVRITADNSTGWCGGATFAPNRFLTALHCLAPGIRVNGVPALIIAYNEGLDLAVLEAPVSTRPLVLGPRPRIGETVLLIGPVDHGVTVVRGVYTGAYPVDIYDDQLKEMYGDLYSYQGLSGSPILDQLGRMVSILLCGQGSAHRSCGALYADVANVVARFGADVVK